MMASNGSVFSRQHLRISKLKLFKEFIRRSLSSGIIRSNYTKCLSRCHHEIILKSRESLCQRHVSTSEKYLSPGHEEILTEQRPVHPYRLVESEIAHITELIKQEIFSSNPTLRDISEYYFDGKGKAFRPMLVMLVAKAFNYHVSSQESLYKHQQQIAIIAEMIHTASLMHDDVIDHADTRRGKPSINCVWGQRKSILAGDYVMGMASMSLSTIGNSQVVSIVSRIIEDLVRGEFMQLGSKENENERFAHYLTKTFKKTASLLANSCKAVAVLGNCDEELSDLAYEYGRNIGISFQVLGTLWKCLSEALPMSIYNLRLRGEIRNLICGDSSSLELWKDPLIWSYDSPHVQIDQRNGSSVNTLRQLKAPDKLIDDLLDFTSCDQVMGKPTAADLRLGLATAPVLFAASKFPELNAMIMRRFCEDGDVEKARDFVAQSNGVAETRILAEQHSKEAVKVLKTLRQSDSLKSLKVLAQLVLNRNK